MRVVEEYAELEDFPAAQEDGVDPADGVALADTGLPHLTGPHVAPVPQLGMLSYFIHLFGLFCTLLSFSS